KAQCLEAHVGVEIVGQCMTTNGWEFGDVDAFPHAETDLNENTHYLKKLDFTAVPDCSGRVGEKRFPGFIENTQKCTIVNNESREIIRIFDAASDALLEPDHAALTLHPEDLCAQIDEVDKSVYMSTHNPGGAWAFPEIDRAGFAQMQGAFEE
ncbi:hypothetical protein AURDEDRAFT_23075, partial [Auricularia subglabra TFB-10046 SS5]